MDVSFLQTETLPYLLTITAALAWLTVLAVASRYSRLSPHRRSLVNMLSLIAGPAGWGVHFVSYYRGRANEPVSLAGTSPVVSHLHSPDKTIGRTARNFLDRFLPAKPNGLQNDRNLFNELLSSAIEQQATDIHVEPHDGHHLARLRVNGILRDHRSYPQETGEHLIAITKVMASLDVADKLKPQDGRFNWQRLDGAMKLDIRVSLSPSLRGEKMALRFLNRPASSLDMSSLGIDEPMQKAITRAVRHPEGLILVAGPTGSGKTSTAYSILSRLSGSSVNIMTIEDPVEYTLPYATQIAINPKAGITFQSGLSTLLRQDPDIILIGEMREPESFRTAIRASLSGHLVLSTMHARDTVQAFANLRDLGIEAASLAAAVKLLVSQRLVRILCPDCKVQDDELDEDTWSFLGHEAERIPVFQPGKGCERCYRSGFVGRTGVFEYMTMDLPVKEWLERGGHESDLRRGLEEKGFHTMRHDAREKVFAGHVWAEDAIRATGMQSS